MLYCLTIVLLLFLVGSVLNGVGFFPPAITAVTSAFGGTVAALLGVLGGLLAGSILKEGIKDIWLKAKRPLALVAGILTVGILTGAILLTVYLTSDPYLHRGMLALDDPLRDDSRGYRWDVGYKCVYVDGTFHVSSDQQHQGVYCTAWNTNFGNFVYEVQMTIIKGDCGGLIFRESLVAPNPHQYYFRVCSSGYYSLWRYEAVSSESGGVSFKPPARVQGEVLDRSIHAGLKQSNLLAGIATSSGIELWANRQRLTSVPESTYKAGGFIGVNADSITQPTEVAFSNAKVWTLW